MNITNLRHMTLCCLVEVYQQFSGMYCQSQRISRECEHQNLDHEDGGCMILRNVDKLLSDYTALHPRIQ
jgi:hypothetical protein